MRTPEQQRAIEDAALRYFFGGRLPSEETRRATLTDLEIRFQLDFDDPEEDVPADNG